MKEILYVFIFTVLDEKKYIFSIIDSHKAGYTLPRMIDEIIMQKSCKSAIKFGENLSPE